MGVTYKLRDEVVQFIISQRQSNPLSSCRQLAELTSQKFGLNLSKSSVHDVLKESGIITPRGRKPKDKFEIPEEKKKQIQVSLSQVKLIAPPVAQEEPAKEASPVVVPPTISEISLIADVVESKDSPVILNAGPHTGHSLAAPKDLNVPKDSSAPPQNDFEISAEYEGAGKIFLKAALWDLGIYSEEHIKETDWSYYLTYTKGVKVDLEGNKSFFIDLPLPIERCIREVADGLINNVKPFMVHKISDEGFFKACMEAQSGFKILKISIVEQNDHNIFEFDNIMEFYRKFKIGNRIFVENDSKNITERSKLIFFPQIIDNNVFIDNILNLKGFDATNQDENTVNISIDDSYENKAMLQEAAEKLNSMYLYDDQNKLVKVKIQNSQDGPM